MYFFKKKKKSKILGIILWTIFFLEMIKLNENETKIITVLETQFGTTFQIGNTEHWTIDVYIYREIPFYTRV
jgi:hypothetical protein